MIDNGTAVAKVVSQVADLPWVWGTWERGTGATGWASVSILPSFLSCEGTVMSPFRCRRAGFTLVELLVVIAIIGV
ncbi:MAG TPA: type II secretion system protein, partial [Pirellulaceae bacterium]|nr:type II secretion system protein [Pirellulaceae bacterium]